MPHYNPNQPRVPQGRSNGGEWTRSGNGSASATDFSSVRPRLQVPKLEFGGGGAIGGGGGAGAVHKIIEAARARQVSEALAVFAAASALNDQDRQAVLTLQALKYPTKGYVLDRAGVRSLTHREVNDLCKKFEAVQSLTDLAAAVASSLSRQPMSASVYGTAVHHILDTWIKSDKSLGLRSEVSIQKTIEETGHDFRLDPDGLRTTRYATLNSKRIDALEREGGRVCVFDIKTGRGLSVRRADDIALTLFNAYQGNMPEEIILVEVRPNQNTWLWKKQSK